VDEVPDRQHALIDVMIATPAQGRAGWRAKAEVLAIAIEEDNTTFDPEVRLAVTLAKDLMAGIAPPRHPRPSADRQGPLARAAFFVTMS
jgi:hypothetical protein